MATRRDTLRYGGILVCGTSSVLAGCTSGRHHRPELVLTNRTETIQRLSVSIERNDGSTLLDRRVSVHPDEPSEFSEVLPHPTRVDDEHDFRAVATLDGATAKRETFNVVSGFHRLWIEIESDESIRIAVEVH